jgi:hypothetical protein
LAKKYNIKWAWLNDMLELVQNRKQLGQIQPNRVHRVCVIYIRELNVIGKSGKIVSRQDVTKKQKQNLQKIQQLLNQVIISMSDGKWSLSFEHQDAISTYKKGAKLKPDNPDHLNLGRFFFENCDNYDTFITCSNTRSPARALARRYPYINGVLYSPHRGMAALNASKHGFETWLHEFFHCIEWVSGGLGGPAHGYRKKERTKYVQWKGDNELNYYRWHFTNTLPNIGWNKLQHTQRWLPFHDRSHINFNKIESAYQKTLLEDRQKANKIVKNARKIKDSKASVAEYKKALKLSPYHPDALIKLISYYGKKDEIFQERKKYLAFYQDVNSVNDFYEYKSEFKQFGKVVGKWIITQMSESGSWLEWDMTDKFYIQGDYQVTFIYTHGGKAITIDRVAVYEDSKEISQDSHKGFSGSKKIDITYHLHVPLIKNEARYYLKAKVFSVGGINSNGIVLLKKI